MITQECKICSANTKFTSGQPIYHNNYYNCFSPNPHRESINILIQLVQQANGLDNHIVGAVHIELDLGTRVTVPKAKLRLGSSRCGQIAHKLVKVKTDSSQHFHYRSTYQERKFQYFKKCLTDLP